MALYREDIVDIDLNGGSLHRTFLARAIGKGDSMENRFGVRLFRGEEAVNIGNGSVQGYFIAPDGSHIAITGSTYTGKSGNVGWVQLPQACYNYEGQFTLAIKVVDTSVTGTMRIVDGVINNTGVDGAVAPVGSVPTYQEVLSLFEEAAGVSDRVYALENEVGALESTTGTSYYIAYGGAGVKWTENDPVKLTLDGNDHYLYSNGSRITITTAQILAAASAYEGCTVTGVDIQGHSYSIYYDTSTSSVKVGYGNDANILTKYPVLFATHYQSFIMGLICNFKNNKMLSSDLAAGGNEVVRNVVKEEYDYFEITIPAGQSENMNINISSNFIDWIDNVSLYYTADSGVYSGNVRIDKASYADTIYLEATYQKKSAPFKPTWLRLYYDNMVKDGGTVVGGNVRIRYKYIANLVDPIIDGEKLTEYVKDLVENKVPTYFRTHLATKINNARNNMMGVGRDGESFVFITDPHWETNAQNSPALVEAVLNGLNINVLLCGGDLINQGEKEPMVTKIREFIEAFRFKNVLMPCAFGNHDSNWNDYDGQREHPERKLDAKAQYALMQKQAEGIVNYFTSTGWNFYMDRESTKTRFIVLDTGEDGSFSAYSDLISCLSATPSGYHIVIMAHWLYDGGVSTACTNIQTIIDGYNSRGTGTAGGASYDFTNASGEIFLLLGGHYHNDKSWTTTGGVPVVLTDTDSSRTNNTDYPYVAGTITEQAFDIFTINYSTKAVKAVRVGRGANRSWSRS